MKNKRSLLNLMDFYLVTDSALSIKGTLSDVENAVAAGCRIVQYREKGISTRAMVLEAAQIKDLCGSDAIFLVNDRVDVALAVDADGVHIGQDDMHISTARALLGPDKIIGLSVHNVEEAMEAEQNGADYVGLGPMFNTATKNDAGDAIGPESIRAVRDAIKIPVVAIGGINKQNSESVITGGADSLVAISAVVCSDDVRRETKEFIDIIRKAKGQGQ